MTCGCLWFPVFLKQHALQKINSRQVLARLRDIGVFEDSDKDPDGDFIIGTKSKSASSDNGSGRFLPVKCVRGVSGANNLPINSLWGENERVPLCSKTMSINRFCEIL